MSEEGRALVEVHQSIIHGWGLFTSTYAIIHKYVRVGKGYINPAVGYWWGQVKDDNNRREVLPLYFQPNDPSLFPPFQERGSISAAGTTWATPSTLPRGKPRSTTPPSWRRSSSTRRWNRGGKPLTDNVNDVWPSAYSVMDGWIGVALTSALYSFQLSARFPDLAI